jgi:hypothetical protein
MPPALDRRDFLRSAGTLTAFGLLGNTGPAISGPRGVPGRVRVALLWEPGFPAADAPAPRTEWLDTALEGVEVARLAVADLGTGLDPERCDVLVTPYGSAFPVDGWPALKRFLGAGGGWVNLGGMPCAVPVERDGAGWRARPREVTYHKQLGMVLACPVPTGPVAAWRANAELPWTAGLAAGFAAGTVWEPYYRLSSVPDTPGESGSAGAREAVVRPLVSGHDAEGRALAVPLVAVDRLEGEFAGGRWIFATLDRELPAPTVRALVAAAARGAALLEARPSCACYRGGERPRVRVRLRGFPRAAAVPLALPCTVSVFDEGGASLAQVPVQLRGTDADATGVADLGPLPDPLAPGLYRLEAVLTRPGGGEELRHTTGFRIWDDRHLGSGAELGAGPFALERGGRPFAAAGTTYMASDVHRKFLEEPNPWLWDRDFAAMKDAGVNLVRTGIWTGWRALMPDPAGPVDDGALRALDAWLLTASRHGIPVIFNLFAFLPEAWGGVNPYLDPAAVAAQRVFVGAIARRYRAMRALAWDLINEPSFCNKDHLWSCRPNYDRFERAAWAAWLRSRGVAAADLPPLEAFADGAPASALVVEYRRFAQATFARWVGEMRGALRAAGAGHQLVTVGQDEAGTRDSPNNLFLAPALDFTCVHTWWLNDAIAWDQVLTRWAGKANLVEETGVMFSAHPPGVEARWEEYARDLLERKMAIALGPGGAGFVEWLWSSNCYMPSDNEAAIGLLRADGSAKPELAALRGVAAFAAAARPYLVDREEEPVLLVVPHGTMFSTNDTATNATRRAVRAMQYGCRVGLAAVSEFGPVAAMRGYRLVLVPSPGALQPAAWAALQALARAGARVLVTGPLAELARYAGRAGEGPAGTVRVRMGKGEVLWCPAPIELTADAPAVAALYAWALGLAGVAAPVEASGQGADASVLVHAAAYRDAVLVTVVAEQAPAALRLRPREVPGVFDVALPAGRAALILAGRRDGRVIARYDPV